MLPRSPAQLLALAALMAGLAGLALPAGGCGGDDDGEKSPDQQPPMMPAGSQNPDVSNPVTPGAGGATEPGPRGGSQAPINDAGRVPDDEDGGVATPQDAGPWVPPEPTCEEGQWVLAPGFLPAMRVDYIADRETRFAMPEEVPVPAGAGGAGGTPAVPPPGPQIFVRSSAGVPCANAADRAKCEAALLVPPPFGRHVVTTAGDTVRIWPFPSTLRLLGAIDTTSEAIWLLSVQRGEPPCDVKVKRNEDDGAYMMEELPNYNCPQLVDGGYVQNSRFRIARNGESMEVYPDGGITCPNVMQVPDTVPP